MSRMFCVIIAAVLLSESASAAFDYPGTFPFANEEYIPAPVVEAEPTFKFNADDPGGYIWAGWTLEYAPNGWYEFPWVYHKSLWSAYLLVVAVNAPPVLPDAEWNCTMKDLTYKASDFSGNIGTMTICSPGSCCEDLIGNVKYDSSQLDWHKSASDRMQIGMCPDDMAEIVYCYETMGHSQINCFEYYTSVDATLVVLPCFDSKAKYLMTCPTFRVKVSYTFGDGSWEPPEYMSLGTPEQLITHESTSLLIEIRLCKPYSYYVPESLASASASPTASSESPGSTLTLAAAAFFCALI